ncbi:hypothetical protein BDW62DRAFT_202044 [Aspergillus aurantiobrunneus]
MQSYNHLRINLLPGYIWYAVEYPAGNEIRVQLGADPRPPRILRFTAPVGFQEQSEFLHQLELSITHDVISGKALPRDYLGILRFKWDVYNTGKTRELLGGQAQLTEEPFTLRWLADRQNVPSGPGYGLSMVNLVDNHVEVNHFNIAHGRSCSQRDYTLELIRPADVCQWIGQGITIHIKTIIVVGGVVNPVYYLEEFRRAFGVYANVEIREIPSRE